MPENVVVCEAKAIEAESELSSSQTFFFPSLSGARCKVSVLFLEISSLSSRYTLLVCEFVTTKSKICHLSKLFRSDY